MVDRNRRPVRAACKMCLKFAQLFTGLTLYGFSVALMLRSGLGLNPWDVLHEGLTLHSGLSFGTVTILVSIAVLLLWIPIRQGAGIGTLCNLVVVGVAIDVFLPLLPAAGTLLDSGTKFFAGVVLNAIATAAYIGVHLGPGPRDGLMTGLVSRMGWRLWSTRLSIEAVVLTLGWMLGGTVGIGTLLYAVLIGPLVQKFSSPFRWSVTAPTAAATNSDYRPEKHS